MTLDEFIAESHREIDRFKTEWIVNAKTTPNEFPIEMNEGDWDDQLRTYLGG